jgi:HEAT repeat protein
MHGWWSGWGSSGDNPLDGDASASALIRWIQNEHNDPAVVPRLRTAMRDGDGCVRRVAGSFLGRVDHASAVAALIEALDDPQADTRRVAALGLGLDDEPVPGASDRVPPLMRRLRDQDASVRQAAAWALGAIEAKSALDPLVELLQRDADPRVRQAAAWALGRVGG